MRRVLVWGKLSCRDIVLCGRVGESFNAPNAGRRKPMEKEPWHECLKCGSIFDPDTLACPPCGTENPRKLHLTLKEVVERVWPDWLKIWTKQPSKFDGLVAAVHRERAEAFARQEQGLKAVPA